MSSDKIGNKLAIGDLVKVEIPGDLIGEIAVPLIDKYMEGLSRIRAFVDNVRLTIAVEVS